MDHSFSEDDPYRRKLLSDAGLDPEQHRRIRSIIGPAEIKAIVRTFRASPLFYQPGPRPLERLRERDSHSLENVRARTFRANLHIHTQYSDGRLSIPTLLRQAVAYADAVASTRRNGIYAPYAPFTIGITDHNRVEGCVEAIRRIYESPRKFKNLRVVLGAEVTVRLRNIYQFYFREKRHVHFLMTGVTPEDPALRDFFQPFAKSMSSSRHGFHGAPSATLTEVAQMLKAQDFGTLSMAHPSRVQLAKFLAQPEFATEAMRLYIHLFRTILGRKALYVEAYYQGYSGNLAVDAKEYRTILETAAAERLLVAGGMDTHGGNIFFSKISPVFYV